MRSTVRRSSPPLALTDLDNRTVVVGRGRATVVELWATWCPPCRASLQHLANVQREHGSDLAIVAIAVDSELAEVRRVAAEVKAPYPVVQGSAEIVNAFGALAAVPKVLVFDRSGKLASVIHGAPPDADEQLTRAIAKATR